jgi:hypothetical protein
MVACRRHEDIEKRGAAARTSDASLGVRRSSFEA